MDPDTLYFIMSGSIMDRFNEQKAHTSLVRRMTDRIPGRNKSQLTVFLQCLSEFLQMESPRKYKHDLMLIMRLEICRDLLVRSPCLVFPYFAVYRNFIHTCSHLSPPFTFKLCFLDHLKRVNDRSRHNFQYRKLILKKLFHVVYEYVFRPVMSGIND